MLVTVYLSTLYLNGCQLLCNAHANNPYFYQFRSGPDLYLFKKSLLVGRLWDFGVPILGRILDVMKRHVTVRDRPSCVNA